MAKLRPIGIAASCVLALSLLPSRANATKTFIIEASTEYDNYGCQMLANVNLNDFTASLYDSLYAAQWSGPRFLNDSAWPQDTWESCSTVYGSGGLDDTYGDVKQALFFAGHGGNNWTIWGHNHLGECTTNLIDHTRLGEMGGATTGFAAFFSCSTIKPENFSYQYYQNVRQIAGFHEETWNYDNDPRDFFNSTVVMSNRSAFFNQYSDRPATFASFSFTSTNDCYSKSSNNKLKGDVGNVPLGGGPTCAGQGSYYICAEWIN